MSRVPGSPGAALAAAAALACALVPLRAHAAEPTPAPVPAVVLGQPSAASASPGASVTVSGRVNDQTTGAALPGRAVVLELRVANGWMQLPGRASTSSAGAFTLRVPTGFYGSKTLRARTVAAAGQAAVTSNARAVTVKVPYRPAGRPSAHRFLMRAEGHVVRYDPCRPLGYYVNTAGAPAGALRQVHQAMAKVRVATGLPLAYKGLTSRTPLATADGHIDEAIVVAWTTPARVPALAGATIGIGGSTATWSASQPVPRFFRGRVLLDRTWDLRRYAPRERAALLQHVLMHETAHAVGLHHVAARGQVMQEGARPLTAFGAGDLAGLARLGIAQGCI